MPRMSGYNTYARDIETWNFIVERYGFDPEDIPGVTEDMRSCRILAAIADGWQMYFKIKLGKDVISVLPSFVMAAGLPRLLVHKFNPRLSPRPGNVYLNHIYTREIKVITHATHEPMVEFRQAIPTSGRLSDKPLIPRRQWDKWCANSTCIRIGE
jgi:hypothetical protein